MFDAARAALLFSCPPVKADIGKTHSGLISAFGEHLEKTGLVSRGMSKKINQAFRLRQIADYTGDFLDLEQATEIVESAKEFIAELKHNLNIDFPDLEKSSKDISRERP